MPASSMEDLSVKNPYGHLTLGQVNSIAYKGPKTQTRSGLSSGGAWFECGGSSAQTKMEVSLETMIVYVFKIKRRQT